MLMQPEIDLQKMIQANIASPKENCVASWDSVARLALLTTITPPVVV
jgi:hypothetical protein